MCRRLRRRHQRRQADRLLMIASGRQILLLWADDKTNNGCRCAARLSWLCLGCYTRFSLPVQQHIGDRACPAAVRPNALAVSDISRRLSRCLRFLRQAARGYSSANVIIEHLHHRRVCSFRDVRFSFCASLNHHAFHFPFYHVSAASGACRRCTLQANPRRNLLGHAC